jgi:hypothetical protein
MKTWHFYFKLTGDPAHRSFTGSPEFLASNTPAGCEARETPPPPRAESGGPSPSAILRARISALEAKQPRIQRELALGYPDALDRLRQIDDQIGELRTQLSAETDAR